MTSLFPHPPYAEDQPSAHAILYLHVARAGAMSGGFLSIITAPASLAISRYRSAAPYKVPFNSTTLLPRLLKHSGRGLVVGAVLGVAATYGRMIGREDIEWKDRSWRLLENKGEVDTDWASLGSTAVGAMAAGVAARRGNVGSVMGSGRAVLGGAGLGMGAGVPYMMWTFAKGRKPA